MKQVLSSVAIISGIASATSAFAGQGRAILKGDNDTRIVQSEQLLGPNKPGTPGVHDEYIMAFVPDAVRTTTNGGFDGSRVDGDVVTSFFHLGGGTRIMFTYPRVLLQDGASASVEVAVGDLVGDPFYSGLSIFGKTFNVTCQGTPFSSRLLLRAH